MKTMDFTDWASVLYSDALAHHGIRGQKWGVRRFQNPDGTLTALGRTRNQKESGHKEAEADINKLRNMSYGSERDRHVTKVLSKIHAIDEERTSLANEAYNKAHSNRKESPRYAYHKALNDYDATEKGQYLKKTSEWLSEEISKKSGDWYERKGVSKGFRKNRKEYEDCKEAYKKREIELGLDKRSGGMLARNRRERIRKRDKTLQELEKKSKQIDNDLVQVVMKDLKFPDTAQNRKLLRRYIFWD